MCEKPHAIHQLTTFRNVWKMLKVHFVHVIVVVLVCLHYCTDSAWRMDRKPKVMGDKLAQHKISPMYKRVQKKIVWWHNYFRTRVTPSASNMLIMKWHKGAAKSAQKWSDNCMLLTHDNATGRHIHDYGSCGQNIFVSSHQVPWLFAIKTWYLEKDNFTYDGTKNDLSLIGHYTQMIWATTHKVGCALTKCNRFGNKTMRTYYNYVCNYCPIGNKPKRLGRPYKAGRPCKLCPKHCHNQKLCKNACPVADFWANCRQLRRTFPMWLCHTNDTLNGRARLENCKATCTCHGRLHD